MPEADSTAPFPELPGELDYDPNALLQLVARARDGERFDLLEGLLDAVNWHEQFASTGTGILTPDDIARLRDHYRSRFADIDPIYLAELISTEVMTILLANGDIVFSDQLKRIGREDPELWMEIRAFFSKKELTTALLATAQQRGER
ncbi:hypothetical protein [Nitrolancea hollandica]|uniref:Uncharacterized protein n=1 Tax=Nitrolancea hollandica Lb TaxID=1129897 RepID=I4EI39_9BACT|nr:hypothetical protein [Nitrolancea hollandica]CCF84351.1 hypothetical protein NITHO_3330005 [Nitrolancea hollandica Lb]